MTVTIRVRVTPRGGRDAIDGWDGETLRVRVAAAPADGAANAAIVKVIAKALSVSPSRVEIIRGATSRNKVIRVNGVEQDEVLSRLGG